MSLVVDEQGHDSEIKLLTGQLSDLVKLFTQIRSLTVEQGSVLDRIDQNVCIAKTTVTVGRNEVERSLRLEVSKRASTCQRILIAAILVCLVVLIIR
jgi:t-SNARE complex subunit (syntaxin)